MKTEKNRLDFLCLQARKEHLQLKKFGKNNVSLYQAKTIRNRTKTHVAITRIQGRKMQQDLHNALNHMIFGLDLQNLPQPKDQHSD